MKEKRIYSCEVWSSTTNLKSLKSWLLVLPSSFFTTGLPIKKERFTLLRSPLGNKASKDQFERLEYRSYSFFQSRDPKLVLLVLGLLKKVSGVKIKIALNYSSRLFK